MKDPKDMTREELAEWYDEERDNGNPMDAEIMHRLRNSIDRPTIEVVKTELEPFGRAYRPSINGYLLGTNTPHMQDAVREAQHFAAALRVHLDLRYGPLGMEGGA